MSVLTQSQIKRLPIDQRRKREVEIVYKAVYHYAQRPEVNAWQRGESVSKLNFKTQVLPKYVKPIIEKYKALGKISPDFTVEVFNATLNGETVPQDKAVSRPSQYTAPIRQSKSAVTTAVSQFKSDSIDDLTDRLAKVEADIASYQATIDGLNAEKSALEEKITSQLDTLNAKYRRPQFDVAQLEANADTDGQLVQELPGFEMPQDKPAKAKRSNKRSTKRK